MSVENNIEQKSTKDEKAPTSKKFYSPTIRLTLTLREPDEESCSVFNYNALIAEEEISRCREKEQRQVNGSVDEPEEDDNYLKRVAQHFEEKYGGVSVKKKRRKQAPKFYNYTDLASGYDESDSFIDNSEAFDEALPDEMETILGGYYVNTGQLQFKKVEVSEENSDLDELKNGKRKSCVLKSDENSSSDGEPAKSDEDTSKTDDEENETVNKKLPEDTKSEESESVEIVGNLEPTKSVLTKEKSDRMLKVNGDVKKRKKYKKRRLVPNENQDDAPKQKKKAITVKTLLEEKRVVENGDSTISVSSKPIENAFSSISDVIESVVNAARNHSEDSRDSTSSSSDTKSIDSRTSDETEKENNTDDAAIGESTNTASNNSSNASKEQIKLPENLSSEVLELISQIKKSANESESSGARTFFKSSVNLKLLSLESEVRPMKSAARHALYEYLASFLPCSKDTLMKRAKKLLLEEEERLIMEPLQKLKASIDKIMPALIENYTSACQQVAEEKSGGDLKNGEFDEKKSIASKMPPMKFVWNEETRNYLRELVSCRIKCFHVLKPRKELVEDYVKNFLETKVKSLWPPGWMEMSILLKESQFNSIIPRMKKTSSANSTTSITTSSVTTMATAVTSTAAVKKSSQSSVPIMSNVSPSTIGASTANYNFLANSLALQSLAIQYPTQTDVSYSATPSTGIPYRSDLNIMTAAASLPSQTSNLPLSMDIMARIALANSQFPSTATHSSFSNSTSPPKKSSTSISSSYPSQRSTTPVSVAATTSSPYTDKMKSADASSSSKFNEMFKIDSIINSSGSKSKKEHHMLNHISQYNKHYSHKTEKRKHHAKKDDNVPSKNSISHNINSTGSASSNNNSNGGSSNCNSSKTTAPTIVDLCSIGNNITVELNKKSGVRDQILDLSPNKVKDSKCDKPNQQPSSKTDAVSVTVTSSSYVSVTAKDHNYWSGANTKDDLREEIQQDVQSQTRLSFSSPESNTSSSTISKTTPINRKQRLLQESARNMAHDTSSRLKSPGSDSQIVISPASSSEIISRKSESHLMSNLAINKSEKKFKFNKDESKSSKNNCEEKCPRLEETATATDLLSKIINDTLQSDSSLLLPQFNSNFEKIKIEPEIKSEERVNSPADFTKRPSSRDSHSSVGSLSAERKTPNSEAADIIQDLVTLNQIGGHSIPRRMDYQDSKKHNDLNFNNGSMLSQSSFHLSEKNKSSSLPRMSISGFQNEFFKHIKKPTDESNSSYTNYTKSQDNCSTSELPSLEIDRLPSLNLLKSTAKEGNATVYDYQQSVIIPPTSSRWYKPESKF